jgi:hypothetical protein
MAKLPRFVYKLVLYGEPSLETSKSNLYFQVVETISSCISLHFSGVFLTTVPTVLYSLFSTGRNFSTESKFSFVLQALRWN